MKNNKLTILEFLDRFEEDTPVSDDSKERNENEVEMDEIEDAELEKKLKNEKMILKSR